MTDRLLPGVRDALQFLADHPARLFAVLFAVQAAGVPYAGIVHDAKLYAAQALNAHDGRFADDLFFRYGSQAKYTLFPEVFAPLCGQYGPAIPFWVGYLLSVAVVLAGMQRFLLALLGRTPIAVIGLFLVAGQAVPVGGLGIFSLLEPFFTPRPFAVALTLFALERLLVGRPGHAFLLLLPATIIHPLMTAPGWLAWLLWVGWSTLGRTAGMIALILLTGTAGTAVVTLPQLGTAVFGPLDPDWRDAVLRLNRYADPANWSLGDWLRLAQATAFALGMMIVWGKDARRSVLVGIAVLLAVGGVVVALYAARGSYALLLQGQAYRWVWPLELLRSPLGVALVAHLWCSGRNVQRLLAVVVAALVGGLSPTVPLAWLVLVAGALLSVVLWRGIGQIPNRPRWQAAAAVTAVGVALVAWNCIVIASMLRARQVEPWDMSYDLGERIYAWSGTLNAGCRLLIVLAVGRLAWPLLRGPVLAAVGGPVLVGLAIHSVIFGLPQTEWAGREFDRHHADKQFVRNYIDQHCVGSDRPPVYWASSQLEVVWFDLGCPCYFNTFQLSGNYFNRGTAIEGQRRALVVRAFEVEAARQSHEPLWKRELAASRNVFDAGWDFPPPTRADFDRLVQEPALDLIVLPHEFPGYVATNGQVFLYDARRLRVE